ncbi:phage tail protein [Clostridioides difficile]|uniref:phage tail protein n=1 Tax=Clostridioides difficile TaxID=1496 RepID=UPI000C9C341E|nr:phage tail protein [Clostridioides difficile]MCU5977971.1 hypothetical protein [Clostridioides difficile]MCU6153103.1 hypothetical protein [Clostridioides difficile]
MKINLKELKRDYEIVLCKINKCAVGQINIRFIDTLSRSIDSMDEIQFTIPKFIYDRNGLKNIRYVLYDEIKEERFICLDDREYFVIKEIEINDNKDKIVKAYSAEIKLSKIDINIEDVAIQLFSDDKENGVISLNNYLKQETSWSIGHVDDVVAYEMNEHGDKVEKLRIQESVNSNWHDFFIKDIKEEFSCVVQFDTYNKKINLYDIDSFGDNIELVLTYDNYIKSNKKTNSTNDIVTRLKLIGREEMDIISAVPTGYEYLENYSYFLENGEMSEDLVNAMLTYEEMVAIRKEEWSKLVEIKNTKEADRLKKSNKWQMIIANIEICEKMIVSYKNAKDDKNVALKQSELTKLKDEETILEIEIKRLEQEIKGLEDSIININILCKRETATDQDGHLIFSYELLEELKEFIYCDTFSNDSFLNVEDFVNAGKRELDLKCKPTTVYSIDVVNFLRRILDTGFRQHFQGCLSLGDIIVLYNNVECYEEHVYFVGYTQDFKEDKLNIELSNKKLKTDNTRTIADYLTKSRSTTNLLNKKKYLLNKQKYNRMNVPERVM